MRPLALLAFLSACSADPSTTSPVQPATAAPASLDGLPQNAEDAMRAIAQRYRAETRLAISVEAPPQIVYACKIRTAGTVLPFHAIEGAPMDTRITIYVNDPAWAPLHEPGDRDFPVGSVIVKEKGAGGLGIMEKRSEGWRYGYVSGDGQAHTSAESVAHCVACHEHGTVPAEVDASMPGGVHLGNPRDEVFLTATGP